MKQTFYIDRDEEITSLIDRLKRSKSTENIFVVPERAAILQSIVSLKLFKREASKLKKQVAISTSDVEGRLKIEKAGIQLESALIDPAYKRESGKEKILDEEVIIEKTEEKIETEPENNKNERLEKLGTESFFSDKKEKKIASPPSDEKKEFPVIHAPARRLSDVASKNIIPEKNPDRNFGSENMGEKKLKLFTEIAKEKIHPLANPRKENYEKSQIQYQKSIDPRKEELLKGLFNLSNNQAGPDLKPDPKPKKKKLKDENLNLPVSRSMKKLFAVFAVILALAVCGVLSSVLLPKATIAISLKSNVLESDFEANGKADISQVDQSNLEIPVRVVTMDDSLSYSAQATGSKSSSGQKKAQGKVIIYNEFSNESQSLVATTRLETDDGKIFRLTKAVTVPGMSSASDGSATPGSVEADVIADQGGDAYNIGPSDFKIPGFQGSSKYDKFYAKSSDPMAGGGGDNSGPKIISQQDLDSAKSNAEDQMKNQLIEKVKSGLKPGEILLDEASQVNITQSKTSARINQTVDSFNYDVQASIKSIVFSEDDLKSLFISAKSIENVPLDAITVSYDQSSADFGNQTIIVNAHLKYGNENQLDINDLKNKLLGKNKEDAESILAAYPQIKDVNLEFWPNFLITKVPKNPNRVNLVIN